MRITNNMMISNTMRNVNKSKTNLYTTEQQMSTQKKIDKPSDDPIVAIRALSLRTSLNEITQYLEKNVPDAQSWIQITETSMDSMDGILSDIYTYCNQGSTDSFTITDRQAIIDSIKQLKEEYYSEGNADFSERYVFTGYRTDSSLTFLSDAEANVQYSITQKFGEDDFSSTKYMKNAVDVSNVASIAAADTPEMESVFRLRLAYSACSEAVPATVNADGTAMTVESLTSDEFQQLLSGAGLDDNKAYYISDIGEVAFSENTYQDIKDKEIEITYQKDKFAKYDLKPEHYFDCSDLTNGVNYTYNPNQAIEYAINFSQTIRVNTGAEKVLDYRFGRDLDDLCSSLSLVQEVEEKLKKLGDMKATGIYSEKDIDSMISATQKELDYAKDNMKKTFSKGMTFTKGLQQKVSEEISDLGSRSVRLTLTKSRLTQQQTTFKDLKSSNEDVELENIAIEFSAAETVYQAAIATASKSVRQSLLDYL